VRALYAPRAPERIQGLARTAWAWTHSVIFFPVREIMMDYILIDRPVRRIGVREERTLTAPVGHAGRLWQGLGVDDGPLPLQSPRRPFRGWPGADLIQQGRVWGRSSLPGRGRERRSNSSISHSRRSGARAERGSISGLGWMTAEHALPRLVIRSMRQAVGGTHSQAGTGMSPVAFTDCCPGPGKRGSAPCAP
jgi:hypothetical protein